MAGGGWSAMEKPVLPGLYLNFQAAALAGIQPGSRGIVVVPVRANWGPFNKIVEITKESEITKFFGTDTKNENASTVLSLALMGGAKKVLAYRLKGDDAAEASLTLKDTTTTAAVAVIKLTTNYATSKVLKFTAKKGVDNNLELKLVEVEQGQVKTLFVTKSTLAVDKVIEAINNAPENLWLKAEKIAAGNDALAEVTEVSLTGGNSGNSKIENKNYADFLTCIETENFDLLTLDGYNDPAFLVAVASKVMRLRKEGKGMVAVLGVPKDIPEANVTEVAGFASKFNHEGIVYVGVGATLDKQSYTAAQVAVYIAGLIAGQKLSESITYAVTPFTKVNTPWDRSQQELAVRSGVVILVNDGRNIKVLRGVNTLTQLRQGQNNVWKKIRTIRVMDAINADLVRAAEDNYIGKVNNTEEGRLALVGACKQYLQTLAQGGVIEPEGAMVYLDPAYYGPTAELTPEPDEVYLKWEARFTDVMEMIFGNFIVK